MAAESVNSPAASGSATDLIFLSYARADRAAVEPIAAALRARGASVWYDAGSPSGSGSYVDSVQRALRRASMMLVFVSASSTRSEWVAEEIRAYRSLMAREAGHTLLAIHLDKTRAPIALSGAQAIDAHGQSADDVAGQVARAVGAEPLTLDAPAAEAPAEAARATDAAPEAAPVAAASAPSGQVFVSYARTDRAQVEPLIAALRGQGVQVWDDAGMAQGSSGWIESSSSALHDARTLIVAISSASATSPWVADEVRAFQNHKARDTGRAIIAVHLDQTAAPAGLNGASLVDAQSLAPDVAAGLIVAALPAGVATAVQAASIAPAALVEAAPAAEEATLVEAAPAAEEATLVEESPAAEEATLVETAPAAEDTVVEVVPVAEDTVVEAAPVAEDTVVEASPPAEAEPVADAAPAVEEPAPAAAEETTVAEAQPAAEAPGAVEAVAQPEPEAAPAETPSIPAEAEAADLPVTTPALRPLPTEAPAAALTAASPASSGGAFPEDLALWQKVAGPLALVIVAVVIMLLIVWAHAGFPL